MYIRSLQNVHFNARCKCTFVVHYNVHSNVHYNVHAWLYIQCTFDAHSMFITMYIVMNNTMYIKCTVKCTPQCSTTSNVHCARTTNHVQWHLHQLYITCRQNVGFVLQIGSPSSRNIAESPPHTPPRDPGQGKQVMFGFAATTQRNEVEMPAAQGWFKCSSRAYDLWVFCAASGGGCWAWLAERLLPQKRGTRLIWQAYA